MNSFRLIFFHSATVNCARQNWQLALCVRTAWLNLQLNWSLVTGDRGHGDKSLWHMQTQYQHNIYTNLSQNFVDTFIKYYLLSIIYTLYAAGVRRDCVKWHGGVYRDSRQPRPATPPPPPPLCSIKHGGGPAWRRQLAAAAGRGSRRRSAACPSPSTGVSVMHSSQ